MAITRVVQPERLDALPADDPEAVRSRRDLRWINALMGNFRWMERVLRRERVSDVVEVGAGDGTLAARLAGRFAVTAIDRVPPPAVWPGVVWRQGDLFSEIPRGAGDALIGVMIVHHFDDRELRALGALAARFRVVCLCEPWRSSWTLALARLQTSWCGAVTRHDMMCSIRAGFRRGELVERLGLAGRQWNESIDWRGAIRLVARTA